MMGGGPDPRSLVSRIRETGTDDISVKARLVVVSAGNELVRTLRDRLTDATIEHARTPGEVIRQVEGARAIFIIESTTTFDPAPALYEVWERHRYCPFVVWRRSPEAEGYRYFGPVAVVDAAEGLKRLVESIRRAQLSAAWICEPRSRAPDRGASLLRHRVGWSVVTPAVGLLRTDVLAFNLNRSTEIDRVNDLGTVDLRRCDLQSNDLSGAYLADGRLEEADLRRCVGAFVDFRSAQLTRADLRGALFIGCDFSNARLFDAQLREAEFVACDLRGASFRNRLLVGAYVVDCFLDPGVLKDGRGRPGNKRRDGHTSRRWPSLGFKMKSRSVWA